MIKRTSIAFKIVFITMSMLVMSFMIALFTTAFQIEKISAKFYSAELDSNSGYAIGMIEKLISFDDNEQEVQNFVAEYAKMYPYKIEITSSKSLDALVLLNERTFNRLISSNNEGKVSINSKTYYVKIYKIVPILYNEFPNDSDFYSLILAKEVPLFSEQSMEIIWLSCIILILISLPTIFLLLLFLKRFTNPIVKMSHIAQEIADGNFTEQIEIISRDEIGDLANSINHMTTNLRENERSREVFLAGISHELRTPLTALKANTRGMIDGIIKDDETRKYNLSNMEEIERLIIMVNDLILVSTFEENSSLNYEITDLSMILVNMIDQLKPMAENKHIVIRSNIEESLIKSVDKLKLKQVFVNLLDNAIKFSNEGETVNVSATRIEERIKITMKDGGCSFSEEDLKHLFDRFYKNERSAGLGLGLYISKLIISAHDGEILAYNDENNNATIELII